MLAFLLLVIFVVRLMNIIVQHSNIYTSTNIFCLSILQQGGKGLQNSMEDFFKVYKLYQETYLFLHFLWEDILRKKELKLTGLCSKGNVILALVCLLCPFFPLELRLLLPMFFLSPFSICFQDFISFQFSLIFQIAQLIFPYVVYLSVFESRHRN